MSIAGMPRAPAFAQRLQRAQHVERRAAGALDSYRTAESADPADGGIRMNAALAYYRLGKLAEARAKFTEATGLRAELAAQYGAFDKLLGN